MALSFRLRTLDGVPLKLPSEPERENETLEWNKLHIVTGERQAHAEPEPLVYKKLSKFGKYGQNLAQIVADLVGRKVNANEFSIVPKMIVESAERYLWQQIAGKPPLPTSYFAGHQRGEWYIHKMPQGIIKPYCNGNDLVRVLQKGLRTRNVWARPAKHYHVATLHFSNFMNMMQHYWTGAQGAGDIPLYLAPFVRNEKLGPEEIEQGMQGFFYEVNMEFRGAESPFTNMTISFLELVGAGAYDKGELARLAYVGGEAVGYYNEYIDEAIEVWKGVLKNYIKGDAMGRPFTYPVHTIFASTRGAYANGAFKVIEGDSELFELVGKAMTMRGFTYWLNSAVFDPTSTTAFCCRFIADREKQKKVLTSFKVLEETAKKNEKVAKGVFATISVTGSLTIAGLNLPRYALEAGGDQEKFFEILKERAREVGEYLVLHHRMMEALYELPDLYYMIKQYLNKQEFSAYFATITLIGLPEAALILMDEDYTVWGFGGVPADFAKAEKAGYLMRRMVEEVVNVAEELSEEYNVPVNVEESPAETAASKLFWKDWEQHPEWRGTLRKVLPPNPDPSLDEKGVPLDIYSNTVVPYWGEIPLMARMEVEALVQPKFTGGVMAHLYIGEPYDYETAFKIVKQVLSIGDGKEKAVVYFSWSPPMWACENGHSGIGIYDRCPICGAPAITKMRVVGWNTEIENFSAARKRAHALTSFYTSDGPKKLRNPYLEKLLEKKRLDPKSLFG